MKKLIILLILLPGFFAGVGNMKSIAYDRVIENEIIHKAVLIDVRTNREFDAGHLEGAVNIPYNEIAKKIEDYIADKNQKIIVYCRSGRRSGIALNTLTKLGYTNVINAGAYKTLKRKGIDGL